ncbi:unnamed protein product [Pocillopora meandrina]|uniref:Uncharacterized protein n=1 Tax=Pocillopora meandrina TaxID=46732 RepID=A0AAU9VQ45_9CNID|nr:unnamed protein product [Pocillopora meandrina]
MAGQKASLQAKNGKALQDIARRGYTWGSPRKENWGMQTTTGHYADESIQGVMVEMNFATSSVVNLRWERLFS